jgi:Secretion system C-terminal sorting domain
VITLTFLQAIIPTGVDDELEEGKLKIYPNPTHGDIAVEFKASNDSKTVLTVSDILGKTVSTQTDAVMPNQKNTLKIPLKSVGLSSGNYFIKITNGKQEFYQKVILVD